DSVARLLRRRVQGRAAARLAGDEVECRDARRELRLVRREPRADEARRCHAPRALEPAGARLAEEGVGTHGGPVYTGPTLSRSVAGWPCMHRPNRTVKPCSF